MAALVTVLFFASGMVALAYEVVWVRALGLVVGNSLWAAIAVVAAYMAGIAIGGLLVARLAGRLRRHLCLYGAAEAIAAGVALATPRVLPLLQRVAARFGPEPLSGWGLPLLARFGIAWTFLALPTVAMGATLPLLVARIGSRSSLAWRVGRLYAANTLGAVAGVVLRGVRRAACPRRTRNAVGLRHRRPTGRGARLGRRRRRAERPEADRRGNRA